MFKKFVTSILLVASTTSMASVVCFKEGEVVNNKKNPTVVVGESELALTGATNLELATRHPFSYQLKVTENEREGFYNLKMIQIFYTSEGNHFKGMTYTGVKAGRPVKFDFGNNNDQDYDSITCKVD